MAITQDDFKKVWASTSSVPEYTFSDTDYKNGWEFVGNLPPTRAMWDELQRKNDEKMQFLQENGSMCFDSVADMKSSNLDAGQTAFTKGYYAINDGGSAIYAIRAKTQDDVDDGGSIIFLDNGNVAELISSRDTSYVDTVADMVETTWLFVGQMVTTKGQYSVNDGNGASYIIRAVETGETGDGSDTVLLDNGKIAERIKDKQDILANMVDNLNMFVNPFVCMRKFDNFFATQGVCVADKYLIVTAYAGDAVSNRLYVIDIEAKSIVSFLDYAYGHANGMCYDADNQLVCVMGDYNIIHRFSLSSTGILTYVDTLTLPQGLQGYSIGWNNGLYYINQGTKVFTTKDWQTIISTVSIREFDGTKLTAQGMDVDENFIYLCYSGNNSIVETINVHDKLTGNLVKTFTYQRNIFGELEDVSVYNGYIFISISRPYNDSMLGVFQLPLYKNVGNEYIPKETMFYQASTNLVEIYVNESINIAFEPNGTIEKPYNSMGCAGIIAGLSHGNYRIIQGVSKTYNWQSVEFRGNENCIFLHTNQAGTLSIEAVDNNQAFTVMVSIDSIGGAAQNSLYFLYGYGQGGTARTSINKVGNLGGGITCTASESKLKFDFAFSSAEKFTTIKLLSSAYNLKPFTVSYTVS